MTIYYRVYVNANMAGESRMFLIRVFFLYRFIQLAITNIATDYRPSELCIGRATVICATETIVM